MGKVKFSFAISEIRNKVGGSVYSRNAYGSYVRAYAIPENNKTPAQVAIRDSFGEISQTWKTLTQDERVQWNNAASALKKVDVFRNQYSSNGFHFFMQLNTERVLIGQSITAIPPILTALPRMTNVEVILDVTNEVFEFNANVSQLTTDQSIVVRCTPAQSVGATFFKNLYSIIYIVPDAPDLPYNLYPQYLTKFGAFMPSTRVGWQVYVVDKNTGLRSLPINGYSDPPASGFDPDAQAYFNILPTEPDFAFKSAINNLVISLKSGSNNWAQLDRLWLYANYSQDDAVFSLVNPASAPATEINAPNWVQYQGYTSNGINSYLNLQYNPFTNGVKYTINSASLGSYSRTNFQGAYIDIGALQNPNKFAIVISRQGGFIEGGINDTDSYGFANADALALNSIIRTSATNIDFYKRATLLGSQNAPTTGIPNFKLFGLGRNDNGVLAFPTVNQIGIQFAGSGSINMSELYASYQAFMTALGTAV